MIDPSSTCIVLAVLSAAVVIAGDTDPAASAAAAAAFVELWIQLSITTPSVSTGWAESVPVRWDWESAAADEQGRPAPLSGGGRRSFIAGIISIGTSLSRA